MQVKPVGNKFQVYVSYYDRKVKKSVQFMVGSFDKIPLPREVPDELAVNMHDRLAEKLPDDKAKKKADDNAKELQDWLDQRHAEEEETRRHYAGSDAASYIRRAAELLELGDPTPTECDRIDEQMKKIRLALRRARRRQAKEADANLKRIPLK
jgi:hypothetical protein